MNLKRFNETSEGAMNLNGIVAFPERIVEDGDVMFECGCICLSDVVVHGTIIAQYDLRVIGNAQAESLKISGQFDCAQDVNCTLIEVGKDCIVSGSLSAKHVDIHGSLICNELGCVELTVHEQAVIRSTADVAGDVYVDKTLVCVDGITADGIVTAEHVVAGEYADIRGEALILSDLSVSEAKKTVGVVERTTISRIAQEPLESIKDNSSPLVNALNDVAAFLDNCQENFPNESLDESLDFIAAVGNFLPSYSNLYKSISSAVEQSEASGIIDWYEGFIAIAEAYNSIPEWLFSSAIDISVTNGLNRYLEAFNHGDFSLKSRSIWAKCLAELVALKSNARLTKALGDQVDLCLSLMYGKIGIKSRVVKMYLPDA